MGVHATPHLWPHEGVVRIRLCILLRVAEKVPPKWVRLGPGEVPAQSTYNQGKHAPNGGANLTMKLAHGNFANFGGTVGATRNEKRVPKKGVKKVTFRRRVPPRHTPSTRSAEKIALFWRLPSSFDPRNTTLRPPNGCFGALKRQAGPLHGGARNTPSVAP